ncbi:MAG: hypothetical protein HY324_03850 [Chlamydiia bacterium]|nr:hypothetical protein [Chlamydiia bacterium]
MDKIWVLKVALSRLSPERKTHLETHLPNSILDALKNLPVPSEEKKTSDSFFSFIHWSWYLLRLERYTKEEQKLFLSILPQQTRNRLNQEIGLPPLPPATLKTPLKKYLEKELIHQMAPHILPPSFLPLSSLNGLLQLSKKHLVHLIDLLSLFDLVIELKQIVETKTLRKIYSFLSEEEKKFLKMIAPTNTPSHLPWEGWDGTKQSFRHLLHKRGLKKLKIALTGMEGDLLWYLAHLLDVGRGSFLLKPATTSVPAAIRSEVLAQIEETWNWKIQEGEM